MKWCIENEGGEVFEVTRLYDEKNRETDELRLAQVCVIKFDEHAWMSALIESRTVHRLQ